MHARQVRQMLVSIRSYLSDPSHWCKGTQNIETTDAPQYCLVGAAIAWDQKILGVPGAYDHNSAYTNSPKIYDALARALDLKDYGVGPWNNYHKHEEIVAKLDEAIARIVVTGEIPESIRAIFDVKEVA